MIILEAASIEGTKQFELPERIEEITLGRFIAFKNKVDCKKPQSLDEYEQANEQERAELIKDITIEMIASEWRDYMIEVAKFWSGLDELVIANLTAEQITFIYNLTNKAIASFQYEESSDSLTIGSTKYLYPSAPVNPITSEREYMKGSRIIDSIESFQFEMYSKQLGESKWSVLPHIMAVLCKKKGEHLPLKSVERDKFVAERAKLFEQLPLSEALNLAFFLHKRRIFLLNDLSPSSIRREQAYRIAEALSSGRSTAGAPALKGLQKAGSSSLRDLPRSIARKLRNATKRWTGLHYRTISHFI